MQPTQQPTPNFQPEQPTAPLKKKNGFKIATIILSIVNAILLFLVITLIVANSNLEQKITKMYNQEMAYRESESELKKALDQNSTENNMDKDSVIRSIRNYLYKIDKDNNKIIFYNVDKQDFSNCNKNNWECIEIVDETKNSVAGEYQCEGATCEIVNYADSKDQQLRQMAGDSVIIQESYSPSEEEKEQTEYAPYPTAKYIIYDIKNQKVISENASPLYFMATPNYYTTPDQEPTIEVFSRVEGKLLRHWEQ